MGVTLLKGYRNQNNAINLCTRAVIEWGTVASQSFALILELGPAQ